MQTATARAYATCNLHIRCEVLSVTLCINCVCELLHTASKRYKHNGVNLLQVLCSTLLAAHCLQPLVQMVITMHTSSSSSSSMYTTHHLRQSGVLGHKVL
jgi:hypothetical protein